MTQILDCCRELGAQAGEVYQPKLLFCVVQKRHHTRMFAASDRDADKTGNLPAGEFQLQTIYQMNRHVLVKSQG